MCPQFDPKFPTINKWMECLTSKKYGSPSGLAEPWALGPSLQVSETGLEPEIAQQGVVEIAVGDISVGFMVISPWNIETIVILMD